jgi:Flp pilus assembly protein TadG
MMDLSQVITALERHANALNMIARSLRELDTSQRTRSQDDEYMTAEWVKWAEQYPGYFDEN